MTTMRLSDEQLQAILNGTVGVTPGPWIGMDQIEVAYGLKQWEVRQVDADPTNKHFWPERICTSPDGVYRVGPNPNAAHIARLDPQTVASIITELIEVRALSAPSGREAEPVLYLQASDVTFFAAGGSGSVLAEGRGRAGTRTNVPLYASPVERPEPVAWRIEGGPITDSKERADAWRTKFGCTVEALFLAPTPSNTDADSAAGDIGAEERP